MFHALRAGTYADGIHAAGQSHSTATELAMNVKTSHHLTTNGIHVQDLALVSFCSLRSTSFRSCIVHFPGNQRPAPMARHGTRLRGGPVNLMNC